MKKVILTVDDEEHILELISYNLELKMCIRDRK